MKKLSETYKLTITPLTPIHIGSGEEISPGEYFIFSGECTLYGTDIGYLASHLKQESQMKIAALINNDPIGWVVQFSNKAQGLIKKYARFRSELPKQVLANMLERWGKNDSRLAVRTLQRPFGDPIIPGSSIKGAIRTALIYEFVEKPLRGATVDEFEAAKWERKKLGGASGNIADDPLRHLSISDARAQDVMTVVYQADFYGMSNETDAPADLQVYCECFPETFDGSSSYQLDAALSIAVGHPAYQINARRITKDFIIKACKQFYGDVIKAESRYWEIENDQEVVGYYSKIAEFGCDENAALIRLGWGSGMNAMGLNLAKEPPSYGGTKGSSPRFRYSPKTRRLLDGLPAGWAEIRLENC